MYNSLVKSNDKSVTGVVYPERTYYVPVKDLGYLPRVEFEEVKDKLLNDVEYIKSTSNPFLIQRYMDGIGVGTIAMVSNESVHQMSFQSQVINFQAWNNADDKKTMAGISVSGVDGTVIVKSNGGKIVFPSGVNGTVALEGAVAQSSDLSIIATFNITEANTVIILQNLVGMTSIDWGDGTVNNSFTHTYTAVGEYTAKIYSVTRISGFAFESCVNLTSVVIGNGISEIGEKAFRYCSSLTSVVIGDDVTSIVGDAFNSCTSLKSVTIPDSVTSIGGYAFFNCSSLTSVVIGNGITSILGRAFQDCASLKMIEINALTPPTLGKIAFGEGTSSTRMIVPIDSLETYKTAEGWSDYTTLICSYVYTTDRNKFVKEGITQNTETWTDEEKAAARDLIGALGKSDIASNKGLAIDANGKLTTIQATPDHIFARKGDCLLAPSFLENMMYYGVTGYKKIWQNNAWVESRNNQIPLSDEEKTSACDWIGALPKNTNTSSVPQAYAKDANGSQFMVNMTPNENNNTVPMRENGNFYVVNVRDDKHCTNKEYVDNLPDNLTLTDEQKAKWKAWLESILA